MTASRPFTWAWMRARSRCTVSTAASSEFGPACRAVVLAGAITGSSVMSMRLSISRGSERELRSPRQHPGERVEPAERAPPGGHGPAQLGAEPCAQLAELLPAGQPPGAEGPAEVLVRQRSEARSQARDAGRELLAGLAEAAPLA